MTLICGGGFHGKTTLLKAIEAGVYNKVSGRVMHCKQAHHYISAPTQTMFTSIPLQIPGDGRELIATDPTAVKIRAEDGRWGRMCW